MRATSKLLALALAAALQPAMAGTVSLGFEDISGVTALGDRYDSSFGVKFTSNAWGVAADNAGCQGVFPFQPLAQAGRNCGALLLGTDPNGSSGSGPISFTISSTNGFSSSIAFAFAVGSGAGAKVEVFDARQNLLATRQLAGDPCRSGSFLFCNWQGSSTIGFSGVASTIVFSAANQQLMLDNLAVTTVDGSGTSLPEPGSVALAFAALGALGWARKRTSR